MFSLFRTALGSPVRRSKESAFAMLPLVHKQAIPSRCGVGYTAPFEELEHLRPIVARFRSEESALQFEATTQFVKLLSTERSPPIEEVIQSGVVPRLVEFKMRKDFPQLQGVRYFTTESASNCYESHEQGLLLPQYILFIRDIIRSCLDKYSRGIHTASFGRVMSNGFTHYLDDGTDPIIPVGGIGTSGGLYVLLKTALDFNDQHPKLAVLFFDQLMKVGSYDALHRLLDDLYVKGVTSRVRSMGQLYQAVSNYAPYGKFYRNVYDQDLDYWEGAISRISEYTPIQITVESLVKNIPVRHIRDALLEFVNRRPENYGRNDISSCIACMRQGSEHCNQLGPKRRVQKPLTVQHAIWGLNNAFHLVYPFAVFSK